LCFVLFIMLLVTCVRRLRDLLSFPTRRSSDLEPGAEPRGERGCDVAEHHGPVGTHIGGETIRHGPPPHDDGYARPSASRSPRCADRKSTRLNSSHVKISYAVFCLKKKKKKNNK